MKYLLPAILLLVPLLARADLVNFETPGALASDFINADTNPYTVVSGVGLNGSNGVDYLGGEYNDLRRKGSGLACCHFLQISQLLRRRFSTRLL